MADNRKNTEDFIRQSTVIHKGFYDYSKSIYSGKCEKVTIICPIHGEFQQQARSHTSGGGCQKCAPIKQGKTVTKTAEHFFERVRKKHGDRYDYSHVLYSRTNKHIEIICKHHGSFWQVANDHARGAGCPKCANYSNYLRINYSHIDKEFLKNITGYLYVINLVNDTENFYKVGITKNLKKRFKTLRKFYKIKLLFSLEDSLEKILNDESFLLNEFKNFKYYPLYEIEGKTECLSVNPILEYYKHKENYEIPEKSEYC